MLRSMIRAQPDPSAITQTISRVRAWLASAQKGSRAKIAEQAGVDEKTLRLAVGEGWNPTADTLRKLEAVVPPDWQPPKRRRAA
jgi:DNA-binding phage protein